MCSLLWITIGSVWRYIWQRWSRNWVSGWASRSLIGLNRVPLSNFWIEKKNPISSRLTHHIYHYTQLILLSRWEEKLDNSDFIKLLMSVSTLLFRTIVIILSWIFSHSYRLDMTLIEITDRAQSAPRGNMNALPLITPIPLHWALPTVTAQNY